MRSARRQVAPSGAPGAPKNHPRRRFGVSLAVLLATGCGTALAEQSLSLALSDDTDLHVRVYPADGDALLLVLPSEHGITDGLADLARGLGEAGVETWIADPFTTWFLPPLESSLREIPAAAYAQLIERAAATAKRLYLFGNDKGAGLLLAAAREWQAKVAGTLDGAILVSPDLYARTPAAGNEGELLPIARATNLPVFVFLPGNSTLALRVDATVNALRAGGSDVYVQVLRGVRNRFFFRPDATALERRLSSAFPGKVLQAMKLTSAHAGARTAVALAAEDEATGTKLTGALRPYTGEWQAEDFVREDLAGEPHALSGYRGRVVLVNFWATWCPPCVHEMPSMADLQAAYAGRAFTILAINLGEEVADIRRFLDSRPVNFPVLLDPGQSLPKRWKVFAFPTSYLLGRDGSIRYSVAGAIDWAATPVRQAIDALLAQ